MDYFSDPPYKQLLVLPFRKETSVSKEDIPIYSTINPIIPPFLQSRSVSRYPKNPSFHHQIEILKFRDKNK
jgi:hypothetical protein